MSRHGRKVPVSFYHRFAADTLAFAKKVAKGGYDIKSVKLSLHPSLSSIGGNESLSLPPLRELTLTNCRIGTEFFSDNLSIITSPTFKSHIPKRVSE